MELYAKSIPDNKQTITVLKHRNTWHISYDQGKVRRPLQLEQIKKTRKKWREIKLEKYLGCIQRTENPQ